MPPRSKADTVLGVAVFTPSNVLATADTKLEFFEESICSAIVEESSQYHGVDEQNGAFEATLRPHY